MTNPTNTTDQREATARKQAVVHYSDGCTQSGRQDRTSDASQVTCVRCLAKMAQGAVDARVTSELGSGCTLRTKFVAEFVQEQEFKAGQRITPRQHIMKSLQRLEAAGKVTRNKSSFGGYSWCIADPQPRTDIDNREAALVDEIVTACERKPEATANMPARNQFQAGSGCYECTACGKMTRATGHGEESCELCRACYDDAGMENEHSDGHHKDEPCADCRQCREAAAKPDPTLTPAAEFKPTDEMYRALKVVTTDPNLARHVQSYDPMAFKQIEEAMAAYEAEVNPTPTKPTVAPMTDELRTTMRDRAVAQRNSGVDVPLPQEYIDYHQNVAMADLGHRLATGEFARVMATTMVPDGWPDGMEVVQIEVQTPDSLTHCLRWHDSLAWFKGGSRSKWTCQKPEYEALPELPKVDGDIVVDLSEYIRPDNAAKALHRAVVEMSKRSGQTPEIETKLLTPAQSEALGYGKVWRVMWESGPYEWAVNLTGWQRWDYCGVTVKYNQHVVSKAEWYGEPYYSFDIGFVPVL